jgi:holo-[acyl-carrier protein] synthase
VTIGALVDEVELDGVIVDAIVDEPELVGVAVGTDVVEVGRFAAVLQRRTSARSVLFTELERADAVRDGVGPEDPVAVRRLAARFAAKEAVVKLLRRPPLRWTDVEVRRAEDGAPLLWIHGEPVPVALSLAHDAGVAMATVAATEPALAVLRDLLHAAVPPPRD